MEINEKIRQAASIVEIASQYTTLRKRGRKQLGLCPFHPEKTPSFTVDEEKQLFHCFGCGIGGDIFTLIMEKENLSFPEAIRSLAQRYNIPLPSEKKFSPQAQKLEEKLYKINETTLAFFRKNLFNTAEGRKALDYLKKRKLSEETIQHLKVGYALNSWSGLLDFFQGKGVSANLLEKAGLAIPSQKKDGYYDRFRGRIIFPIFNLSGKVVAFGGRTVIDADPKYLNSPDTPLYTKGEILYGLNFTKNAIRDSGEVILVEGYTDFTALFQAGIMNVAASLGTSLTPSQVSLASRFAPRIIVNYDGDAAGMAAATRAVSLCLEKGAQVKVLTLPEGLDPDSFIAKYGPEKYQALLAQSTPGLKVMIDTMLQEGRMDIPEEKAKIVRHAAKEIEKIPDSIVRSEYLRQASEYLGIEEEVMRKIIKQKTQENESEERVTFLQAEKRLLQILMEDIVISAHVHAEMREEDYLGLEGEPLFRVLSDWHRRGEKASFPKLNQLNLEPRLLSSLSKVLFESCEPATIEIAMDCLFTLRKKSLANRMKQLNAVIMRTEKTGDREKLLLLLHEKHDLAKQLLSL